MNYIILFFILLIQTAMACEVRLPNQLVIFNDELGGLDIYQAQNCETKVLEDLHRTITGLEGRIAAFQLKEMMTSRGHQVEINPQSIVIQQFKTIIRDQLPLPTGMQVKATHLTNQTGFLALSTGDNLELSCGSCLFGSLQPLNVIVHGFDGSKRTLYATADFKKMVKAYRLVSPLASFSSLDDTNLLKEEYTESIPHTDLITDRESLKFYKTNKPLLAGALLKRSDLNAINLVRAGLKTDVVLENQMIRIKTQGISRGNGTIGELVEVYHPQKNKKYQGKVVDINKVLVEL